MRINFNLNEFLIDFNCIQQKKNIYIYTIYFKTIFWISFKEKLKKVIFFLLLRRLPR